MKNILYVPQFSMNDKSVMFIDKDGAFIALKIFLKYLREYLKQHEGNSYSLKVLLPPSDVICQTVFYSDIEAILESTGGRLEVHYETHNFSLSPIINRYNFNAQEWAPLLDSTDIVINNIPEISRNIRAVLGSRKIPLISYHHFPDYIEENQLVGNWQNGELFSYFWRQLDGALSSDLNVFNCKSSLRGWLTSVGYFTQDYDFYTLTDRHHIYLPYTDLDEYKPTSDEKFSEFTAVFPARITESLYTNWQKVFALFSDDKTKGRVIICNPSEQKGIEVLEKMGYLQDFRYDDNGYLVLPNGKILVSPGFTREQYIEVCSKSHVGICLYEHERYGGIAIREVVGYGNVMPVCLNKYECAKWYNGSYPEASVSLDELTPEKYNEAANLYGGTIHAGILRNFRDNEHYMTYYPNFEKLMAVIKE